MEQALLSVEGLTKHVVLHTLGGRQIDVLDNVSFSVAERRFLGVAGPSGAGKSSLLKCLYRTYVANAGVARYRTESGSAVDLLSADERSIVGLRRTELGYVSQFLEVPPRVPAVDIVAAPLMNTGVPRADARERAAAVLDRLGIDEGLRSSFPAMFSGGEQQRVNVARALISPPRLLLLDEPTSALDHRNREQVVELLREAIAGGTTMIGVMHDPEMLDWLADDVIVLEQGRLVDRSARSRRDAACLVE